MIIATLMILFMAIHTRLAIKVSDNGQIECSQLQHDALTC
jgi:hypothetical protein